LNNIKNSAQLELLLDISLPDDYINFIDEVGYLTLENISMEVYGYKPDFDFQKLPCVIAAQELYQESYKLKAEELVISDTGYEGFMVVLDVLSGNVFEVNFIGEKNALATSFSEWLESLILENESAAE